MISWVQNGQAEILPKEYLEYIFTRYVPDGSLIVPGDINLDNIDLSKYTHIIHDCASNPVNPPTTPGNIILTGSYNKPPNTIFFPFWAIWMSCAHAPLLDNLNHRFVNKPRNFKVSCLNGTPWVHRKLTYLQLTKKPYFKDIIYTFNKRSEYKLLPYEELLTDSEINELQTLPEEVSYIADDSSAGIDLSLNHPAYQDALVNLVTETTVDPDTPFLSEKTFKPIVAGQLFVLIATPGAIAFLRNTGIDTFDDVIDHSYDNELDLRTRIRMALNQIDQLVQLDQYDLYNHLKPRLLKNSEYFQSQEFRNQFLVKI